MNINLFGEEFTQVNYGCCGTIAFLPAAFIDDKRTTVEKAGA